MESLSPPEPVAAGITAIEPANNQPLESVIEHKRMIRMPKISSFVDILEHYVSRDPLYPANYVNTIYYDTPDLQAYRESRHGFYCRTKVRLRWYTDIGKTKCEDTVTCYLEVKRRNGRIRNKKRIEVEVPAAVINKSPLKSPEILRLGQLAAGLLPDIPRILVPTLLIRYHRDRFFDRTSNSRIAVDQNISCCGLSGSILPVRSLKIPVGIFEIKGASDRLPRAVNPLAGMIDTKMACGKYLIFCNCLLGHPLRALSGG